MSTKKEHGTTRSYIVGFILSLIFTAIPYYLVVHKTVSGSALLATILAFGVLQMFVQVFFFLHLGRGPKPLYNVVFFAFTVGTILVVVLGSIFIINNLYSLMAPTDVTTKLAQDESIAQVGGEQTGACQTANNNHQITIKNGQLNPVHVNAKLCDTLTFITTDDKTHTFTFGTYNNPQNYGGQRDIATRKNYPKTINLNQTGTYSFRDTANPELTGDFTVDQ